MRCMEFEIPGAISVGMAMERLAWGSVAWREEMNLVYKAMGGVHREACQVRGCEKETSMPKARAEHGA